jgi:hypothetical protein
MAMDLSQDCPHCGAKVGEICSEECEVNGEKVKALYDALYALDLTEENIALHPPKPEEEEKPRRRCNYRFILAP